MTSFVQSILLHFRFTGAYLNTMEGPDTIHGQLQVCITQYMMKKTNNTWTNSSSNKEKPQYQSINNKCRKKCFQLSLRLLNKISIDITSDKFNYNKALNKSQLHKDGNN